MRSSPHSVFSNCTRIVTNVTDLMESIHSMESQLIPPDSTGGWRGRPNTPGIPAPLAPNFHPSQAAIGEPSLQRVDIAPLPAPLKLLEVSNPDQLPTRDDMAATLEWLGDGMDAKEVLLDIVEALGRNGVDVDVPFGAKHLIELSRLYHAQHGGDGNGNSEPRV